MRVLGPALALAGALLLFAACTPATPIATPSPTPRATSTPTATLARATAAPKPSATRAATPTATPTPSPTPKPTNTVAVGGPPSLIVRGPSSSKKVAFTFDMGSISGATLELLAVLATSHLRATYFVTGEWVEKFPSLLREIVAAGHGVGNHSYSHPDFTKIGREEMLDELNKTEDLVKRTAGVSTRPYWRPPFGAFNDTVLRVVRDGGYRAVYWTLDSTDWREDSTPASVAARVVKYADGGAIIVMHGALKKTAQALPEFIPQLRAKGLEPTSLSDLLDNP